MTLIKNIDFKEINDFLNENDYIMEVYFWIPELEIKVKGYEEINGKKFMYYQKGVFDLKSFYSYMIESHKKWLKTGELS